jgi:hypothetical protein
VPVTMVVIAIVATAMAIHIHLRKVANGATLWE